MSIVLRNVKGTALTYEELDNNINQLIYSASIGPGAETNTNDITLYYTGSASPLLSPRTITLTIPAPAPGNLQTVTNIGSSTTNSITATSFVKTEGTVDQVLLGTGVTSPLILTPGSGTDSVQPNNNIYSSIATGDYSFAFGGQHNEAAGDYSIAIGGVDNLSSGDYSAIIGGEDSVAKPEGSFIGGGRESSIDSNGEFSAIIGGTRNTVTASGSAIITGASNVVGINHNHSSILAGNSIATTRAETAYASSIYASGSADATDASGIFQLSLRTTPPTSPEPGMLMWSGSAGGPNNLYFYKDTGFLGSAVWFKVELSIP
ncbi:hypothetical protein N9P57_00690 [Planktomarina temperata]|nr:hypothetical protein [Planktomarina temperata]